MTLAQYKKTVVAVIGAIVTVLALYGTDADPELVSAITTLLTAAGVFWFRNA